MSVTLTRDVKGRQKWSEVSAPTSVLGDCSTTRDHIRRSCDHERRAAEADNSLDNGDGSALMFSSCCSIYRQVGPGIGSVTEGGLLTALRDKCYPEMSLPSVRFVPGRPLTSRWRTYVGWLKGIAGEPCEPNVTSSPWCPFSIRAYFRGRRHLNFCTMPVRSFRVPTLIGGPCRTGTRVEEAVAADAGRVRRRA